MRIAQAHRSLCQAFSRLRSRSMWLVGALGLWSATAPAVVLKPISAPWLRLEDPVSQLKIDPKGHWLAYVKSRGNGLELLDLRERYTYHVASGRVGASFFWAPDGCRLFYREEETSASGSVLSHVKAYDCALKKSVAVDTLPGQSGLLTFDPRDLQFHVLFSESIRSKKIFFPDERLARWQTAQRKDDGTWLATQHGVLWLTQGGLTMRRLPDDGGALESFDVSPDGNQIAWATSKGNVYASNEGQNPVLIGPGRDPSWHPEKPFVVYSAAHMVGHAVLGYDLRVCDLKQVCRYITDTPYSQERWPRWYADGQQILYTKAQTTDLYRLDFSL